MKKMVALLLTAALLPASVVLASAAEKGKERDTVSVQAETQSYDVISLTDEAEIREKFVAHFSHTQAERREDDFSYSWRVDGDSILRTNNVDTAQTTVNTAILTYTKNRYDDFELSVDYKMGAKTVCWPVVGIRQQIPGKRYDSVNGGAGIFMQDNGKITIWGPINGGLSEQYIPNYTAYRPREWHNMVVRAEGKLITVWVDEVKTAEFAVNTTDYLKGYVSLQSVNNDCRFKNFKIRALGTDSAVANEPNMNPDADEGIPLEYYMNQG